MSANDTKLTGTTVKAIAKLARLYDDMEDVLVQEYLGELSGILDLADQLQSVDTKGIDIFDGARTVTINDLRDDEPVDEDGEYSQVRQTIINNFPNQQNNLLVIQGIFESD